MDAVSKVMKEKLRAKKGYAKANKKMDIIWLLDALDEIMVRHSTTNLSALCK